MKRTTMKRTMKGGLALALAGAGLVLAAGLTTLGARSAHAFIRGGGAYGGGMRVASRTTWAPGVGVSRTTVGGAGYYGGGYVYHDDAHRLPLDTRTMLTARSVSGAFTYDRSTGFAYRYAQPTSALPSGCEARIWAGTAAWSCAGTTYTYDVVGGVRQYVPVYD
jgi:hypothetical protein